MKIKLIPSTPFGPVAISWAMSHGEPKIFRVLLCGPECSALERLSRVFPEDEISSCAKIDRVASEMEAFLNGQDIQFSLDLVQLNACPLFQQAVLRAEHAIPRGSVSTYKLIAIYLGKPRGARIVGNALANNPFPIIIPCHRAIRSDRSLGGYQGGLAMKRALLEKEGISFDSGGRVVVNQLHYEKM
jgi:methylated-DNA-[protein]-cysteine S-methyltransferase